MDTKPETDLPSTEGANGVPPQASGSDGFFFEDDINPTDEECPKCGNGLVTRCCGGCGGDGWVSRYEEDPNWYEDDEDWPCDECHGHGTHHWCQKCGWDMNEQRFLNGKPAIELPDHQNNILGESHENPRRPQAGGAESDRRA